MNTAIGDAHFVEYTKEGESGSNQMIYTSDDVLLSRSGEGRMWRITPHGEAIYNRATAILVGLGWRKTRRADTGFTMEDRDLLTQGRVSAPLVRRLYRELEGE